MATETAPADLRATLPDPDDHPTAADWHAALGHVPMSRIWFHPLPGTATVEQAVAISESKPLVELVNNTIVEKTMGATEARIAMDLGTDINVHSRKHRLGRVYGADCTLRMPGGNLRLPDVSFIRADRVPDPAVKAPMVCPDLVVEVLSEDNTAEEITQKLRELFGGGTRLAWVVDHRVRTVAVHTRPDAPDVVLTETDMLDGGDVLPGFTLPLAELFRDVG